MLRSKFPTGECVCGCKLIGVDFVAVPMGVTFTFQRGNSILRTFVENPKKSVYKDQLAKEILRVTLFLESIFFTYLTPQDVLDAKSGLEGTPAEKFEQYINNIKSALQAVGAFEEPICLKVLSYKGKPSLPKYVSYGGKYLPFIKKESDITRELRFTTFENQNYLCH